MERKQISLEQLSDIYAFRIVVPEESRTATARSPWCIPPGTPCPAASRTTSRTPSRTTTSRSTPPSSARAISASSCRSAPSACIPIAEYGVAAHALYKDPPTASIAQTACVPSQDTNAYRWLRHLVGMLLEGDNPEEFLEHTKLELFQDQVFCFTPKGRLIALPRGANPIDFAYAVHTDIGNTCVGAKINGRPMPLVTELRNGDEVEIICSEGADSRRRPGKASPSPARRARPSGGRPAMRCAPNTASSAARSWCAPSSAAARPSARKPSLRRSGGCRRRPPEDVMAAVGRGELASADVVRAVFPEEKPTSRRSGGAR